MQGGKGIRGGGGGRDNSDGGGRDSRSSGAVSAAVGDMGDPGSEVSSRVRVMAFSEANREGFVFSAV